MSTPRISTPSEESPSPAPPNLDPETLAILEIEKTLAELDRLKPGPVNARKPSTRVLGYLAERYKIIGAPGRKARAQGGK